MIRIFIALIFFLSIVNFVFAGVHFSESFTSPYIPQTYTTGTVTLSSGAWDLLDVRGDLASNSYGATGGSARLSKNATSYMITPSINTLYTVSFYYRTLNTGSGSFKIQKSINGGTFTDIATQAFSGQTYTFYTLTVNDASSNIRIKILSDNNPENLIIDEVTLTDILSDPSLVVTPTSFSGFVYMFEAGPSSSQSFSISGSSLTGYPGNITVAAPADYEVSSNNSIFSASLNVAYSSATLASTTLYVRLKAGLATGSYNSENVTISGGGATAVTVTCNGSVAAPPNPLLAVTPSSLTNFSYYFNSGPSTSQSFSISGANLTGYPGNISLTAPTDYEISLNNSTFTTSLNVPYTSATLTSTNIYARLKAGLAVGSYNSEIITVSGGGATDVTVTCSGSVLAIPDPALAVNPTTLPGFAYTDGFGPSSSQSFTLSGTWLTGYPENISVIAPTNYEVSTDNTNFTNSVTVPYTSATLTSTTIYARLKTGLAVGSYNSELIAISGGGASSVNVICSGSVTAVPPPSIAVNPTALTGFSYIEGNGPSTSQSFTISGTWLTGYPGNITLTAPTNYEISTNNTNFSNGVTVPYSSSSLASTSIYVRLKGGLAIASYNLELIAISGGGAGSINVTCSGSVTVVPPPYLSAFSGALTGFSYVVGNGPSASQITNIGGENLTGYPGNITVTAPSSFEVSLNNSTYSSGLTIAYTSATLASTSLYVRLKSGLSVGIYSEEALTVSGGGANTITIFCSGQVTEMSSECGNETFTNIPTASSSSYVARTWTGDDGNTWNATNARTDQTITGKAICFKGYVESPVSPNGIGSLTITTKFPFSDGTLNMPVYVNTIQVGTVPVSSTVTTTTISNINITGNVQVKIQSDGTKRAAIDDLTWTCYAAAPTPELTVTPTTLSNFTYVEGSGPSASQTYSLSGANLTGAPGNITVTAPANYELSLNNTSFSNSLDVSYTASTLAVTTIYVRLKSGLSTGNYNSEIISNAGGGASTMNVSCSGTVTEAPTPVLVVNPGTLSGFSYIYGYGPSSSQSFELSGSDLAGYPENISIYAPTNYEISTDNIIFACSLFIPFTSENLASVTIYARLKSGLNVNTYNSEFIEISGGGASLVKVSCNGEVFAVPNPSISVSTETLSGFNYVLGAGPSASQSFLLSGIWLTGYPGNITITAPEDYEISSDNAVFYDLLSIHYYSDTLDATTIYVRLKAGLPVNVYNNEIITISGGGGNCSVVCNGSVTHLPMPVINAVIINGSYNIGSIVPVMIHADATGYTEGNITIQGYTATGFTDNGDNTYTVSYTVNENDNDVSSASEINISIVLDNQGSQNAPYTASPTGTTIIDAHRPVIDSAFRISNTEILVYLNEFAEASSISAANDGGFTVSDRIVPTNTYSVTAINSGNTDKEILLTVANFNASALNGLNVQYINGGNGTVADAAGNLMNTSLQISINAWDPTKIVIKEDEHQTIYLYPNPAHENFFVNTGNLEIKQMILVNDLGEQLKQVNYSKPTGFINVNTTNILPGIYFLKIQTGNTFFVKKILLK